MDFTTALIDMLRGDEEEEILNRGGPIAKPAPLRAMMGGYEAEAAGSKISDPDYDMYVKEAKSSGEPIMSKDEYKVFKAGG